MHRELLGRERHACVEGGDIGAECWREHAPVHRKYGQLVIVIGLRAHDFNRVLLRASILRGNRHDKGETRAAGEIEDGAVFIRDIPAERSDGPTALLGGRLPGHADGKNGIRALRTGADHQLPCFERHRDHVGEAGRREQGRKRCALYVKCVQGGVGIRRGPGKEKSIFLARESILGQRLDHDRFLLPRGEVHARACRGALILDAGNGNAFHGAALSPGFDVQSSSGEGDLDGIASHRRAESGLDHRPGRQGDLRKPGGGLGFPDDHPVAPWLLLARDLDRVHHGRREIVGSDAVLLEHARSAGNNGNDSLRAQGEHGDQRRPVGAGRNDELDVLRVRQLVYRPLHVLRQPGIRRRKQEKRIHGALAAPRECDAAAETREHEQGKHGTAGELSHEDLHSQISNIVLRRRQNRHVGAYRRGTDCISISSGRYTNPRGSPCNIRSCPL